MNKRNYKRTKFRVRIGLATFFLMAATIALAQVGGGFDLSWWTADGGGTVSRGGTYELTGVVGQPDPGVMTGGDYSLEGGFLSGGVIETRAGVHVWELYGDR